MIRLMILTQTLNSFSEKDLVMLTKHVKEINN